MRGILSGAGDGAVLTREQFRLWFDLEEQIQASTIGVARDPGDQQTRRCLICIEPLARSLSVDRVDHPVALQKLLRAMLCQAFYSIRSERQLMERLEYDRLFRCGSTGLGDDDTVSDHSTFSQHRDLDAWRRHRGEVPGRSAVALKGRRRC